MVFQALFGGFGIASAEQFWLKRVPPSFLYPNSWFLLSGSNSKPSEKCLEHDFRKTKFRDFRDFRRRSGRVRPKLSPDHSQTLKFLTDQSCRARRADSNGAIRAPWGSRKVLKKRRTSFEKPGLLDRTFDQKWPILMAQSEISTFVLLVPLRMFYLVACAFATKTVFLSAVPVSARACARSSSRNENSKKSVFCVSKTQCLGPGFALLSKEYLNFLIRSFWVIS